MYKFFLIISKINIFSIFYKIAELYKFNSKNIIFIREGMFIDCLQKKSVDKFLKKLFITSVQFFNINYLNYKFIKFLIDELYKKFNFFFHKGDDLGFGNVIINIIILFIWVFQFSILVLINITMFF